MLAKRADEVPSGDGWMFEPKWDGFRALVFRDAEEVYIQSRDKKPLARYFPELLPALREMLPSRCVLDGEIVIATPSGLDFEALQLRLHPATSRVQRLATEMPASIVLWDVLFDGETDRMNSPFRERRSRLEALLAGARPPVYLTPMTFDPKVAADWFRRFEGAGLDGVMAKPRDGIYEPDKRAMLKVKHQRECDCVVAGFRWHKKGEGAVGSLLLGLWADDGALHHVGVAASFTDKRRVELAAFLSPYREDAMVDHPWRSWAARNEGAGTRVPGGQSRWSQGKDLSWEPVRPELVAMVAYDHMQGSRFRHTAQFRRWRPDKSPRECTYAQLEVVPPHELAAIFATR
jgi:ATP-dependent DNA ligase